jgi:hypothetical protein
VGFDWVGCWRSYAQAYHWTPGDVMGGMTFGEFYGFAFGEQKYRLTAPGEAGAKGLPPMKRAV